MTLTLFGKPVSLWLDFCSINSLPPGEVEPFVNLYIRVTAGCNASCRFCCNGGPQLYKNFNPGKLAEILEEIGKSGIRLNRINLTGGEISTCPELTKDIIRLIENNRHCHFSQVQLQTNGILPSARSLMALQRVDVVSLSLHHCDFERLAEIYRCPVSADLFDFDININAKTSVSCNLIRGYIDTPDKIERMIRFAALKGFGTIGFAGLMKLNEYCREKYVNPWMIDFDKIPALLKTEEKSHEGACRCRNYLYTGCEHPVGVYVRETINTDYCGSSLLFDGEYLRQGFNKNNIIY